MVVKKETEHPRILPSLEHMKIVSVCVCAMCAKENGVCVCRESVVILVERT